MKLLIDSVHKASLYMYWIAGVALVGMMSLTVADVTLRLLKLPIEGTFEIVSLLGAVVIGFAIPQTTLKRGHVLMDFLTERLSFGWQSILHLITRLMAIFTFILIGWNLFKFANDLKNSGQVSMALKMPEYPVAYGIAFCCLLECFVLLIDLKKKKVEV